MKSLRAIALIFFIGMQVLLPIRAYAFVPVMMGFISGYDALASGALAAWRLRGAILGLGVGGGLAAALSDRYPDISKCLAVVALGKPGLCQPAGWPRDSTGAPTPPSTAPLDTSSAARNTAAEAHCRAWVASAGANYVSYGAVETPAADGTFGYRCYWSTNTGNSGNWYARLSPSCPTGYTLSGSTCVLSNAAVVKKPAGTPCQLMLTAGVVGYDPQNPACPTTAPTTVTINGVKLTVSPDGKTITLVGPNGESGVIQIGSGSIGVVQNVPMTDDIGSPITQVSNTTIDNSDSSAPPYVTNQNVDYKAGQGQTTTGDPVISPPISCAMISNCSWANAQIQQQQLELQQQQAQTEAEIKSNTTTIAGTLQGIKDFINPPAIPDPDLTTKKTPNESVPVALDTSDKYMGGTASCPPPLMISFTLGPLSASIPLIYEPICSLASAVRPFLILTAYVTAAYIIFRN